MFTLAQETPEDWWEVEALFDTAFAPGRESLSSYRLRDQLEPVQSLCFVARDDLNILAGAVRHWPIQVINGDNSATELLLGPIAVHPTRQGEGLGEILMRHAISSARDQGYKHIVLVGDAPYYGRFGFARQIDLKFPQPTNPERVLALDLTTLSGAELRGTVCKAE